MLKILQLCAVALSLSACSAADSFGDRAVAYNVEAERARTQTMLLNIVRSAYRKPIQFTDLTSVSGSASASGGFGSTLPFSGPASAYSLTPNASVSGGPTFNVATLNTKEFYSGILNPIALPTIASYMQQGRRLNLLFTLFLAKIVVRIDGKSTTYDASGFGADYERFQELCDELQDAGLTTQPSFVEQGAMTTMDSVAGIQGAGLELVQSGDTPDKMVTRLKSFDPAFCFEDRPPSNRPHGEMTDMINTLREALACENTLLEKMPHAQISRPKVALTIVPRSTLGVIYTLGSIARRELGLTNRGCEQDPTSAACQPPMLHRYVKRNGKVTREDDPFFKLTRGGTDPSMTVSYEGKSFGIMPDPEARDHSAEILELTEELLALNSSAKDLPAPSLISVH